jgi:membrane protein
MNADKRFFLPSLDDDHGASFRHTPPPAPEDESDISHLRRAWRKLVVDHKASRLSAALTYRTIFSLVPVAIVCIVIVRGVVHLDDAQEWMRRAVYSSHTWTHLFADYIDPDAGGDYIAKGIDGIMAKTWELHLTDVGVAGGLLLIWAALGLFCELEYAFNDVLGVRRGRPWIRRLTNYWAFITLGPLLLFGSLYGAGQTMVWLSAHPSVSYAADLAAAWIMLLATYKVMPNATLHWGPAVIGSFVSAVLWVAAKWGFGFYVRIFMPYSQLYGSLALIPLFLFWLYMIWWIVLFGLEVAAFRQGGVRTVPTAEQND